jgi:hypothetical protein
MVIDKCVNEGTTSSTIVCDKVKGVATSTTFINRNCVGSQNKAAYYLDSCINFVGFGVSVTCSGSSIVVIWSSILLSLVYILFN